MSVPKLLLVTATLAVTFVCSLPADGTLVKGSTSLMSTGVPPPSDEGYSDGFYYRIWPSEGPGKVAFNNGPGGQFDFRWTLDNYYVMAGKGWNPGSRDR